MTEGASASGTAPPVPRLRRVLLKMSGEALMGELQQELPFPRKETSAGKWQPLEHIYSLAAQP